MNSKTAFLVDRYQQMNTQDVYFALDRHAKVDYIKKSYSKDYFRIVFRDKTGIDTIKNTVIIIHETTVSLIDEVDLALRTKSKKRLKKVPKPARPERMPIIGE